VRVSGVCTGEEGLLGRGRGVWGALSDPVYK
jgi:hypothetical protein